MKTLQEKLIDGYFETNPLWEWVNKIKPRKINMKAYKKTLTIIEIDQKERQALCDAYQYFCEGKYRGEAINHQAEQMGLERGKKESKEILSDLFHNLINREDDEDDDE